jgi:hypothetical protein
MQGRADEESGADEQRHGERDLRGDERRAHAVAASAAPNSAAAFTQRALEVAARHPGRGEQPEEQARADGEDEGEREHDAVDAGLLDARNARRARRDERLDRERRQRHAEGAAGEAQDEALRDELAREAAARGAEGRADRQLPGAARAAGQEHVRDVGAGDE